MTICVSNGKTSKRWVWEIMKSGLWLGVGPYQIVFDVIQNGNVPSASQVIIEKGFGHFYYTDTCNDNIKII